MSEVLNSVVVLKRGENRYQLKIGDVLQCSLQSHNEWSPVHVVKNIKSFEVAEEGLVLNTAKIIGTVPKKHRQQFVKKLKEGETILCRITGEIQHGRKGDTHQCQFICVQRMPEEREAAVAEEENREVEAKPGTLTIKGIFKGITSILILCAAIIVNLDNISELSTKITVFIK